MTGLGLAAALADDARCTVRLIDAGAPPEFSVDEDVGLRVSALAPATVEMLENVGAWSRILASRACPYDKMQIWDAAAPPDGPATVRFDASEFAAAELGFIVENELIRYALFESLQNSQVIVDFGEPLTAIERRNEAWQLGYGSARFTTDLLIAADGSNSFVRESAGIPVDRTAYEQVAVVTHLVPAEPHNFTARQRFLETGPIGLLPLADGRVSVVWSTTPEQAARVMRFSDADLGARLSEASDYVLGDLEVAGPRGSFPLGAAHARHYVQAGLALVGDAAHTVHPLAGQGVNLGIADVQELAGTITRALDAGEFPADRPVLRRYERARRGQNAAMINLLTGLNRLFAADSALVGDLRRAGMRLFNLAEPARRKAVDIAFGTSRR